MSNLPIPRMLARTISCLWLLVLALTSTRVPAQESGAADSPDVQQVTEFLSSYCVRCHGPDRQKGDLRLDTMSRDFTDRSSVARYPAGRRTVLVAAGW